MPELFTAAFWAEYGSILAQEGWATFIMVFVLFILGVSSIREFALPLMAGIICGGYSSVCITGALWYVFKVKFAKK